MDYTSTSVCFSFMTCHDSVLRSDPEPAAQRAEVFVTQPTPPKNRARLPRYSPLESLGVFFTPVALAFTGKTQKIASTGSALGRVTKTWEAIQLEKECTADSA